MTTRDIASATDAQGSSANADIEIFDPPMCCPTGLCGPTLDQTLLDVDEMVLELQAEGLRVERGEDNAVHALARERLDDISSAMFSQG